jgi:hypothetical protein
VAADHRHVAGVVKHPILLLVGEVVLLVDDDQTEVGEGKEQGRTRTNDGPNVTIGDTAPDLALVRASPARLREQQRGLRQTSRGR